MKGGSADRNINRLICSKKTGKLTDFCCLPGEGGWERMKGVAE